MEIGDYGMDKDYPGTFLYGNANHNFGSMANEELIKFSGGGQRFGMSGERTIL